MKRCTVLRPSSFGALGPRQAQRWHSYDKASLTREALLRKVEAGLGRDTDGDSLKVDPEAKTISTAAGDLPISPIFDPAWMQARRRTAKAAPGPPLGRFRRKLANNPFAQALATPIRRCPSSATSLPRYFLQDFELIKHPTTGTPWWAPGPLSFEHVQPTKRLDEAQASISSGNNVEASAAELMSTPAARPNDDTGASEEHVQRLRRAPITSYMLNRKLLVDMVGGPNKKYLAMLLAARSGMAIAPDSKTAVWREDMGDVLLQMMRQQATDALATRGNRLHKPKHKFIEPCANWQDVKGVGLRGSVLWLPEKKDAADQYATLDIGEAQYGRKMVVHNLHWLLGEREQWPSMSVMKLHLLLWRLQGYLAEPDTSGLGLIDSQPPSTMRGPNPELIQPEDWARPDQPSYNTPVFLIHDGGGTTFAYHCLGILGRYVYGVHNPYFYTGEVFEGGIPEMGRTYAKWIRQTVQEDEFPARRRNHDGTIGIMLGGWSLGGLLSMEVARQLADDDVVRVSGILMIDSIYPGKSSEEDTSSDEASTDREGLTQNQIHSRRCMAEAVRMVRQWRLPEWSGRLYNRRPRVVLLRAKEHVPTKDGRMVGLDLNREDELLGWGDYDDDMFCDVFDVDGHHFDMFAFERIDGMTRTIKKGLDRLEECSQMMMFGDGR
ncbi:Alpha/Beta hydrolase protein [Trichoderma compactum]